MPETQPVEESRLSDEEVKSLESVKTATGKIRSELSKIIVGQGEVIDQLVMGIFSQGHCLLEGVPGLAKTLMVSTLAKSMKLDFSRVQFTPDLMPSDITGTEVIQEDKLSGAREFRFIQGPIFANIILADEINRTPPKTQAALLEAMQERQVTIGGTRHPLPDPFFVLATQNPIEQEGTYTLPEAQQDRFMFKVFVDYPDYDDEYQIAASTTSAVSSEVDAVLSADEILDVQKLVRRVPVPAHVIHYALRLVRATRVSQGDVPDFVPDLLSWGAGPRAVQYLILGAKAKAVMEGRSFATLEDVKAISKPVLRHRIITTFNAESNNITSDDVVTQLLEKLPERREQDDVAPELAPAFNAA
ncbi:MAG: MoxR family ATPase [Verrucomicrobiales bacterium]|jgi:MoxR-like ATPase|nr:MoxR family ATPase [Verrucomicrobiales bacterium]MDA7643924.1 MoxR family ATPase [Verrucomicrobiales bacterium]MDB2346602.1 MoxR family ATPase [Verrucomicrobiales bacterium]MDF1785600.1 MoxR family ATPase [Verrucomicrobiales bacterium]